MKAGAFPIVLAMGLSLAGCATTSPAPAVAPVLVPVPQGCPAAADDKRPEPPSLGLVQLDPTNPSAVARAYATAVARLQAHARALSELLDACK